MKSRLCDWTHELAPMRTGKAGLFRTIMYLLTNERQPFTLVFVHPSRSMIDATEQQEDGLLGREDSVD